jgi:HAD superfamily hydrolase (TIGR01549 family)
MDASTAPNGADSPATPPNKVIFFDLDDTLLDRHPARIAGMRRVQLVFGFQFPSFSVRSPRKLVSLWERARDVSREQRRTSDNKERVTCISLTRAFWSLVQDKAVRREEDPSDDQLEACWRTYKDAYEYHLRATPGARDALHRLRDAGYKIGILTNGHTIPQRHALCRVGLWHLVDGMVDLDTPGSRRKPYPDMFEVAVRRFDAPPGTLMVGDSWRNDVIASKAAGLTPVWFVPEGRQERDLVEMRRDFFPDVRQICNFEELLEHLGVEEA